MRLIINLLIVRGKRLLVFVRKCREEGVGIDCMIRGGVMLVKKMGRR